MISLINKDLFRPSLGNYRIIISVEEVVINWYKFKEGYRETGFYYFRRNNVDFIYVPKISAFLVPEDSDITEDILFKEEWCYDDWEIEKISNEPDPSYIINWYKKSPDGALFCSVFKKEELYIDKFRKNDGRYRISNKTLNYEKEISVKMLSEFYVDNLYVCYSEKTAPKIQREKIREFENFLRLLIWIKMKP